MDRLRALRYFAKLAETLNFSETAAHFRVPSSSVSRRIKDLEDELGAALFIRTTRSVQLTDLGKLYLNEISTALHSIDMADELIHAQSKAPTGTVRITAMPSYAELFVISALAKLRKLYPEINFDCHITDQVINLSGNEVDIAIRASANLPDNVVARHLVDHDFTLVAAPAFIEKYGMPNHSSDLKDCPAIMYRTPHGVLNWLAQEDSVWKPISLNPKYISNHGQSLLESALAGDGIALLPSWGIEDQIKSGQFQVINLEDGPLSISGGAKMGIYLLYHPPKFHLQKIRVAVDFLLTELRQKQD